MFIYATRNCEHPVYEVSLQSTIIPNAISITQRFLFKVNTTFLMSEQAELTFIVLTCLVNILSLSSVNKDYF